MTAHEVIDFFAPHESSVDAVVEWLVESGLSRDRIGHSVNKQWIQFDATAAEAEDLLYAEFWIFEHSSGSHDISTESYHIPAHIQEHVDYVTPGTRLRVSKRPIGKRVSKRHSNVRVRPEITKLPGFPEINSTSCNVYVTADCTRSEYSLCCQDLDIAC